jgi:drug/metabolite transporter (DMT)-like permease
MALGTTALVLLAALLHASWNAVLRGGRDRFWSMAVINLAVSLPAFASLPFIPVPARASWPFILASGTLHVAYSLLLVRMYRLGELGETYPIARGSSPVLVTLGAALFAGERLGPVSLIGVALISCGIVALALRGRRLAFASAPAALMTGICIAVYTVVDGLGVRAAGSDIAYIGWMFTFEILTLPLFLAARGLAAFKAPPRAFVAPAIGGLVSLTAYGIVILALRIGPMGPVSALRETSSVFAALIGWLFLKETLTARRLGGCIVIACGAVCLGLAH